MLMSAALMWDNPVKSRESLAGQSPVPSAARIRMQSDQSRLLSLAEEAHAGDACLPAARSPDAQLTPRSPSDSLQTQTMCAWDVSIRLTHGHCWKTGDDIRSMHSDQEIMTILITEARTLDESENKYLVQIRQLLANYWWKYFANKLAFDEIIFMYWKISQKYIFWLFLT